MDANKRVQALDELRDRLSQELDTTDDPDRKGKDRELLDVLTSIRFHTSLDQAGRLLTANASRSLRSAREMAALFCDIPEAIANTNIVSERLEFTLNDLGYKFPHFPVPDGDTMDSFLAKRVEEGVCKRYGVVAWIGLKISYSETVPERLPVQCRTSTTRRAVTTSQR